MKRYAPTILIALLLAGCNSSPDEWLVDLAKSHEKSQAEQSQQMARMQQEVAEGSRKLVEADAKARQGADGDPARTAIRPGRHRPPARRTRN